MLLILLQRPGCVHACLKSRYLNILRMCKVSVLFPGTP